LVVKLRMFLSTTPMYLVETNQNVENLHPQSVPDYLIYSFVLGNPERRQVPNFWRADTHN